MPSMSRVSSDPPVDLEKGATGVKAAATKEVNPRVALCVKVLLDVFTVIYVLFITGLITWMVRNSNNWWDPWPVLIMLPLVVFTISMAPKMNYATKRTPGSDDDSDLSAKLLAS